MRHVVAVAAPGIIALGASRGALEVDAEVEVAVLAARGDVELRLRALRGSGGPARREKQPAS